MTATTLPAAVDSQRCPICHGSLRHSGVSAPDRLVTGEGPFEVLECPSCELGITQPQLEDRELSHYYEAAYYEAFCEWDGRRGGSPLIRARAAWREWSSRRRAHKPPFAPLPVTPPGRVLDVGCGDGELLQSFADAGWDVVGLDPSETAVEAVRRRGLEAERGTLLDHPWEPESFQVITFKHSLEHIPDPVASLQEAARLLAPGGVLVISVPNWRSWQRNLFRSRWSHLELPRHQHHFSPKALTEATQRVGLQPVLVGTESNVISPVYSLHYVLAGRWTFGWKMWASYALGSCIFPVVRLVDHWGGGDCCHVVAQRDAAGSP